MSFGGPLTCTCNTHDASFLWDKITTYFSVDNGQSILIQGFMTDFYFLILTFHFFLFRNILADIFLEQIYFWKLFPIQKKCCQKQKRFQLTNLNNINSSSQLPIFFLHSFAAYFLAGDR